MRLVALAIAAACIGVTLSIGATAGHSEIPDPNDTRGRLDVRVVTTEGSAAPRWTILTWGQWTAQGIWDSGYITINLDTFGTPRPDYYVLAGSVGTHLFGELWRDRANKRDYRVSGVRVRRTGRASMTAKVPLANMRVGERRLAYTWYVETLFTGDRCRRVCFDLVPDQGVVAEPLPVVQPTPTVTPTGTPTGTPTPSASPSP